MNKTLRRLRNQAIFNGMETKAIWLFWKNIFFFFRNQRKLQNVFPGFFLIAAQLLFLFRNSRSVDYIFFFAFQQRKLPYIWKVTRKKRQHWLWWQLFVIVISRFMVTSSPIHQNNPFSVRNWKILIVLTSPLARCKQSNDSVYQFSSHVKAILFSRATKTLRRFHVKGRFTIELSNSTPVIRIIRISCKNLPRKL